MKTYTLDEKYTLIAETIKESNSKNPIKIVKSVMQRNFVNIHGPEHHYLDGAAFLTAFYNAGGNIDIDNSLRTLAQRTIKMPGAMCGYWGICGSVASIGAAVAVIDNTGPLSNDSAYSNHMKFTSSVIAMMGEIGGPRCCKRNAFISISEAVKYASKHYGVQLEFEDIVCEFTDLNPQCIKNRCQFHAKK